MVGFQFTILELKSSLNGRIRINLNGTVIRLRTPLLATNNLFPIIRDNFQNLFFNLLQLIVIVFFHYFITNRLEESYFFMILFAFAVLKNLRCYHTIHNLLIMKIQFFNHIIFCFFKLFRLNSLLIRFIFLFCYENNRFNHIFTKLLYEAILNCYHHYEKLYIQQVNVKVYISLLSM